MFQRYFQIVRSFHKTCPLTIKKKTMPGIRHQLQALENAPDLVEDPEKFEELEADFMHVNKTHRQHEAELQAQRKRVRHIMVRNKYFQQQRLPNLLLYAEKEEMRNLHARDPDEWTIERLAESFPATPDIVKKIIHSKWRPYSAKRIRAHDEAVIHNWERIKNNKEDIQLPPELREHLSKFAARNINHTLTAEYTNSLLPKLPTPKSTEFSSIITSCKKYAEKPKTSSDKNVVEGAFKKGTPPDAEDETYLLDNIKNKRQMRLEEWQKYNKIEEIVQLEDGMAKTKPDDDSKIIIPPENPSGTGYIEKFASNEIVISPEDRKRYEMSSYKERVHIPRKLWRKGGTYRVEDCYYDDDGEFLYRVPGMSGTQILDSKKDKSSR